eukprot:7220716-Karenia_brevis.AAC.1
MHSDDDFLPPAVLDDDLSDVPLPPDVESDSGPGSDITMPPDVESDADMGNTLGLDLEAQHLSLFADAFLAFASELLQRIGKLTKAQAASYANKLPPAMLDAFHNRRRCTFTWMSDTSTLANFRSLTIPRLASQPQDFHSTAADVNAHLLLRDACIGIVVLNQRERTETMAPMLLAGDFARDSFKQLLESRFGRAAPPRAVLQAARSVLSKYGQLNHFDNSCEFAVDMHQRSTSIWQIIRQACALHGIAWQTQDVSSIMLNTLRINVG